MADIEFIKDNEKIIECTIEYTDDYGVKQTIGNDRIYQDSLRLTEILNSGSELQVGSINSACFEIQISDISDITGKIIDVKLTITDRINLLNVIIVPFGKYIIESAKLNSNDNSRKIVAYDLLSLYLDVDITEWYNAQFKLVTKANYKGNWSSAATYQIGDIVLQGKIYYQCKMAGADWHAPPGYEPAWNKLTAYSPTYYDTCTFLKLRNSLFEYIGLQQEDAVFIDIDDLVIYKREITSLTFGEFASDICLLLGSYGKLTNKGVFSYVTSTQDAIDITDIYNPDGSEFEEYDVIPYGMVYIKSSNDSSFVAVASNVGFIASSANPSYKANWIKGVKYKQGDFVLFAEDNKYYECLKSHVSVNKPNELPEIWAETYPGYYLGEWSNKFYYHQGEIVKFKDNYYVSNQGNYYYNPDSPYNWFKKLDRYKPPTNYSLFTITASKTLGCSQENVPSSWEPQVESAKSYRKMARSMLSIINFNGYRSCKINLIGQPKIKLGQKIQITVNGKTINSIVLKRTYTGIQNPKDIYEASGSSTPKSTTNISGGGTSDSVNSDTSEIFSQLLARITKLEENTADTGWITVTSFASGVTNSTALPNACAYRRIGDMVYIKGRVAIENYLNSRALFTLPEEFRPKAIIYYPTVGTLRRIARIYIQTTGVVNLDWFRNISDDSAVTGSISWVEVNACFSTT